MQALRNVTEWFRQEMKRIGATKKRLRKKILQQNKRATEKYDRQNKLRLRDVYEIIRHNMAEFGGTVTCIYCYAELGDQNWTLEHVVPLSRGGSHTINNIAIACKTCNHAKGSQTFEEFMRNI